MHNVWKCVCGRIRPGCKTDSREEGIQNSGRLAGTQAKPEREAEHVCPVELDDIQNGTGNEDERLGLTDPWLVYKCFLASENANLQKQYFFFKVIY